MISTVQMPLPIRAAIAPSDWPQRCAPSPESLMISTMCSLSVSGAACRALEHGCRIVHGCGSLMRLLTRAKLRSAGSMPNRRAALPRPSIAYGCVGVADAEVGLHAARGLAPGAHRLDHGRRAGDDVAAGVDAGHRGRQVVVGVDVAALVELEARGLADDRVGVGADREHHQVASRNRARCRPPAPAGAGPNRRARPAPCGCSACRARCPCSSPRTSTGLVSQWNSMPSSSAWWTSSARAGASARERR